MSDALPCPVCGTDFEDGHPPDCFRDPADALRLLRDARREADVLRGWKSLHDAAPDGAKAIVIERMQDAAAIEPIVRAWREANAKLTIERDQARRDLAATQREADRLREQVDALEGAAAEALALLSINGAWDWSAAKILRSALRQVATKEGTP